MKLTRADLESLPRVVLKSARSPVTADVLFVEVNGQKLIVRDFSGRSPRIRDTWCKRMVRREVSIYKKLDGLPCVPAHVELVDDYAFSMEFLEASPLPHTSRKREVGRDFFDRLNSVIEEIHNRGIAHGDLRKRNILISADRQPYIIDFETAVIDGPGWVRHRIFRMVRRIDLITVIKLKQKYFRKALTEREQRMFARKPFLLRVGQFFRKKVYRKIRRKNRDADLE